MSKKDTPTQYIPEKGDDVLALLFNREGELIRISAEVLSVNDDKALFPGDVLIELYPELRLDIPFVVYVQAKQLMRR